MKSGSKFVKVGLAMIYFNRRTIKLSILINYKANIKQIVNAVLIKKFKFIKSGFLLHQRAMTIIMDINFFQMAICWLSVCQYIYKGYCAIYKIYSLWHKMKDQGNFRIVVENFVKVVLEHCQFQIIIPVTSQCICLFVQATGLDQYFCNLIKKKYS